MARLVMCLLALAATGLANTEDAEKVDPAVIAKRQLQISEIFQHIYEPTCSTTVQSAARKCKSIEENLDKYSNVTAAKIYAEILKNKLYLPRSVPFSVQEPAHVFEAMTLFNVLYSAKKYDTFYETAAYLRNIINEAIFVYTLSIVVIYRRDTQCITLPPIYETFPSLFNNGEIIATAQRINIHGHRYIQYYPSTYSWDESIVIKANATEWPYLGKNYDIMSYFTNDYELNAAEYMISLVNPYWLGGKSEPAVIYKKVRGEALWFYYRQLLASYYMGRLSNHLGEIPDITKVVEDGFNSGLVYGNGIPVPSRPDNYRLDQPQLASKLRKVKVYESRIWDAIDKGFYVNIKGEQVSFRNDTGLEILGRLIESNADSPNRYYYKNIIRIWKQILGNSIKSGYLYNNYIPLVVPSALDNYKTALRDPAFYVLSKHIFKLFAYWQKQLPLYKPEELILPHVAIEKIEVDKLVTYFEYKLLNVTSSLYQSKCNDLHKDNGVLVEQQRLTHKPFNVHIHVKSKSAKKVIVKLFIAPKYDSRGLEIPLQQNTENFFLLDMFPFELKAGKTVISRNSSDFGCTATDTLSGGKVDDGTLCCKQSPYSKFFTVVPQNLLLPKGTVCGMTFQFVVSIQKFDGIKEPYASGYRNLAFPYDRPLYTCQIKNVKNMKFQDVKIFHEE